MKILIRAGADVDKGRSDGWTPFHVARRSGLLLGAVATSKSPG
jgi:hypothetical protein